ncbi:MAG: hypothetical protein WKG01_01140 [Kofleriaceae bacterium]
MKLLAIVAVLACASPALAEPKAEALFKKGKKLLAEKQYSEACAAFENSDKLDPGIGVKLNTARCFEEWGKLSRAYRWYSDAESMAKETKDDRASQIRQLIDVLDPEVPRLTITLPEGADVGKVRVKLDGKALKGSDLGTELRVDPGPHEIEYRVKGAPRKRTVPLERGGSSEIALELEAPTPAELEPEPIAAPVADAHPGRGRRIAGVVIASAGVIGVGVAGYVTLDARSSYHDALETHCMGVTNMCNATGLELTQAARSRANTATVIAILGGVAIAGGVVLYVTAPKRTYIAPVPERSGGGVVFGGNF